MATYQEQLDSVQAAIAKIEAGGQAWDQGGRSLTQADLGTLYEREAWLRKMVARQDAGGVRMRQAVPRG